MGGRGLKITHFEDIISKSLYINRAVRHFYGTEFYISAGFGLVGSSENCTNLTN